MYLNYRSCRPDFNKPEASTPPISRSVWGAFVTLRVVMWRTQASGVMADGSQRNHHNLRAKELRGHIIGEGHFTKVLLDSALESLAAGPWGLVQRGPEREAIDSLAASMLSAARICGTWPRPARCSVSCPAREC